MMRIGILGSGLMGGKLGTLFARAGTPADAAREADVLLLAVHWSRVDDVLAQAGEVPGRILVSCVLPMNADNTALVVAHASSGAEVLAKKVRRAPVVSAFGTVPGEVLFGVFEARRGAKRPAMLFCGDDAGAKDVTAGLIRDVGFEPLDLGPLRMARYTEPFSLLMAELAYERTSDPAIAYRFEHFGAPARRRGARRARRA